MSGYRRRGSRLAKQLAVLRAQAVWSTFEQKQDADGNLIVTQEQLDQMAHAFWGEQSTPAGPGIVSAICAYEEEIKAKESGE